jgi:hypothetical protein
LEEGHEGIGEGDHGNIVYGHLILDLGDIDGMRFAEVHDILNACIEEDGIEVWVGFDDAGRNVR